MNISFMRLYINIMYNVYLRTYIIPVDKITKIQNCGMFDT